MIHLQANLNSLAGHAQAVMQAALEKSEYISLISVMKKPYSAVPARTVHDALLSPLSPMKAAELPGIREWPYGGTGDNHHIMLIYSCTSEFNRSVCSLGNLFEKRNCPENITFYTDGYAWLSTVTLDGLAFFVLKTKKEKAELEALGLTFREDPPYPPYPLPRDSCLKDNRETAGLI